MTLVSCDRVCCIWIEFTVSKVSGFHVNEVSLYCQAEHCPVSAKILISKNFYIIFYAGGLSQYNTL